MYGEPAGGGLLLWDNEQNLIHCETGPVVLRVWEMKAEAFQHVGILVHDVMVVGERGQKS